MIKLKDILESTLGAHYPGDAGEKETGFLRGGKVRKLGIKAGKPEPWYEGGGYEQKEFPTADYIYGKKAPEDMVVKKRVIRDIKPVTKFNESQRGLRVFSQAHVFKPVEEAISIPIEIGDTVLGGKFKNKRIVVKDIGKNEKGDITINGKPLMKYRLIPQEN